MAIFEKQFWRSHLFIAVTVAVLAAGVISVFGSLREIVAAAAPNSYEGPTPPTNLASLLRNDPMHTGIGEFVFLNDVSLEPGPAPSLFYAVGAADHRVLVQFDSGKLHNGKASLKVDIQGVIHQMPTSGVARRQWRLKKRAWEKLAGQPVYIVANEITTSLRDAR